MLRRDQGHGTADGRGVCGGEPGRYYSYMAIPVVPTPAEEAAQLEAVKASLTRVYQDLGVQRIYTNGFALAIGNADMHVVLQLHTQPIAILSMSFTLAKTLHARLGQMVSDFESKVERPMLTTDEVDAAFSRRTPTE